MLNLLFSSSVQSIMRSVLNEYIKLEIRKTVEICFHLKSVQENLKLTSPEKSRHLYSRVSLMLLWKGKLDWYFFCTRENRSYIASDLLCGVKEQPFSYTASKNNISIR